MAPPLVLALGGSLLRPEEAERHAWLSSLAELLSSCEVPIGIVVGGGAPAREAIELAKKDKKIFIIGGAQIYEHVLKKDIVQKLDITHVHESFEADVYFPEIDSEHWEEEHREDFKADDKNKYDYSFVSYKRKY